MNIIGIKVVHVWILPDSHLSLSFGSDTVIPPLECLSSISGRVCWLWSVLVSLGCCLRVGVIPSRYLQTLEGSKRGNPYSRVGTPSGGHSHSRGF